VDFLKKSNGLKFVIFQLTLNKLILSCCLFLHFPLF
jgi:hypothetical protein